MGKAVFRFFSFSECGGRVESRDPATFRIRVSGIVEQPDQTMRGGERSPPADVVALSDTVVVRT